MSGPTQDARQLREALRVTLIDNGPEVLTDPVVLGGLLADLLPDSPQLTRGVLASADIGTASMLSDHAGQGMDAGTAIGLAASILQAKTLYTAEICQLISTELAIALRIPGAGSAAPGPGRSEVPRPAYQVARDDGPPEPPGPETAEGNALGPDARAVEPPTRPAMKAAANLRPQPSSAMRRQPSAEEGRTAARPRIRVPRWKLVSALLAVAAILAAVFIVINRAPAAPALTAAETVVMQQVSFKYYQTRSVSASCPARTQMVGGGFSSDGYAAVYSSYPSGPSTWTIVGGNYSGGTPVPIIAYATCVQADFSLGLTIASSAAADVRSGTPAYVIASCPAGSTVLGGGPRSTYRGRLSYFTDLPIAFSSYPNLDRSSWTAGVAPGIFGASVRAYAICARSHVSAANIVSGHLNVTGTNSTTVQCETGQLLTQGGYYSDASDDRFKPVYSHPEGPAPALWGFEARFALIGSGISPSATIYGICIRYS